MNQIDLAKVGGGPEQTAFWRHPHFRDLGLLAARFRQHRYALHTHPTYVIALITQGCERVRVGREAVLAPAGTVLVVNPEEWHDGEAGAEDGWAYRTFYPSVALMSGVAAELGRTGPPLFRTAVIDDPPLARLLTAAHHGSTAPDHLAAETSMLVALRHLVLRHASSGAGSPPRAAPGSRTRLAVYARVIEEELARPIALGRLAAAAGVGRFQVIRDFKAMTGLTPALYIRDRRLRRANGLMAAGAPLVEAAAAAGFADQSHLTRSFRATHGVTPGMFRAR